MFRKSTFVCLLTALAFIGGCKSVNTVQPAFSQATITPVADKRVITDSGLNRIARVVAIRQGTASGNLRLDVDVLNTSSNQQRFNYLFEWFDETGMQVYTPMSKWEGKIIEGGETITLVGIAPTPKAKDFRLKFQKSRG